MRGLPKCHPILCIVLALKTQLHKVYGKRALGITINSNSSVVDKTKIWVARHSNLKVHARYHRFTDKTNDTNYERIKPSRCTSSFTTQKEGKKDPFTNIPNIPFSRQNMKLFVSLRPSSFYNPLYSNIDEIVISMDTEIPLQVHQRIWRISHFRWIVLLIFQMYHHK